MIRFHMLYDQIIRFPPIQYPIQVIQPFVFEIRIYRIHNCDLLIQDHIRIISHSIWYCVLSLEQIYLMIIYSCVLDTFCNLHIFPSILSCKLMFIFVSFLCLYYTKIVQLFLLHMQQFYVIFPENGVIINW